MRCLSPRASLTAIQIMGNSPTLVAFTGVGWSGFTRLRPCPSVISRRHTAFYRNPMKRWKRVVTHLEMNQNSGDATGSEHEDKDKVSPEQDGNLSPGEQCMKLLREIADAEDALCHPNPYGTKMSHETIAFDEEGFGPRDRYVYVEEKDCIGCTNCQTTAINTFFLEPEYGRARVFDQTGDTEDTIEVAIDTCPVNCIYYVNWEDLVTLELMRREQIINNWARLVGGQDFLNTKKTPRQTTVMDSNIIRCEDCPGRGCAECPMYGVGENPEYLRKKKMREMRKKTVQSQQQRKRRVL